MAAGDAKFRLILEGDDKNALAAIDKTVAKLNDVKAVMKRHSMERQKIAKDERRDRFQALSDEEKRARLTQRKIVLERQLARARASGNAGRSSALGLSVARNRQAIGGLGGAAGVGGAVGGAVGAIGGPAGIAIGAGIGVASAVLLHWMRSAATNAIRLSDQIGDMADQAGLTTKQVMKIQQGAGYASVSANRVFAGLSTLQGARSGALSGDVDMQKRFARFGVTGKMLGSSANSYDIGTHILKSMGNAGMTANDRGPLGALLGRRPEATMAALRQAMRIGDDEFAGVEGARGRLDKLASKQEAFGNKAGLISIKATDRIVGAVSGLLTRIAGSIHPLLGNKMAGLLSLDPTAAGIDLGARSAGSGALKKKKLAALAAQLPFYPTVAADGLARMGFSAGRQDPEGSGMLRKQLKVAEDLYRVARETKDILKDGL